MSSPCLVMNRVGSIEPFENPSDTRKLESSSYHALGACLESLMLSEGRVVCQLIPIHLIDQTGEVLPASLQSMQNQPWIL
ncbi:hypothetical protein Tco_0153671 [Tanacetum coccineum]